MSAPEAFALSTNALARNGSDIEDGVSATRRPPTPPPKKNHNSFSPSPNNKVDLDEVNGQIDKLREDSTIHDGCMGISLDTVLNTLKGDGPRGPQVSALDVDQRGFFPSVRAMVQKTLSPMKWSDGGSPRDQTDDCTLEDDYDLMNRLPSWKTIDPRTPKRSPGRSTKQVQFQYLRSLASGFGHEQKVMRLITYILDRMSSIKLKMIDLIQKQQMTLRHSASQQRRVKTQIHCLVSPRHLAARQKSRILILFHLVIAKVEVQLNLPVT